MGIGQYHRRAILTFGASTFCSRTVGSNVLAQALAETESSREHGSLLMCGGGKLPDSLLDRFCETSNAANSRLVLIPTASERSDQGDYSPWLELWKQRGWREVQIVHADHRRMALSDDFGSAIEEASAVWITGGDQDRLAQRYQATVLIERLHRLLQRGGVVGGTSAGAAIISKTMIASGNDEPVIGRGFGLLPNVIVDQHFRQKNRFERLAKAVAKYPTLIGIGIDESTGIELSGGHARVIGLGQVHGYQDKCEPQQWSSGDTITSDRWSALFQYGWVDSKEGSIKE